MRDEAEALLARLELEPHPEGGHFRRVWEHHDAISGRPLASMIVYVLRAGERSRWHRIDATEIWHHYSGDPMEILVWNGRGPIERHVLGDDVLGGHEPFVEVPPGAWQAATSLGAYTFVGCTVTPAFVFDGFELAPTGWEPPASIDDRNCDDRNCDDRNCDDRT